MKRFRSKFIQYDENGNLLCYKCHEYLPLNKFDINKDRWYRDCKDTRCKECKYKQHLRRRDLDHDRINLDRLLLMRWHGVKDRANQNGYCIEFDWTFLRELWNIQEGKCAISGIQMTYEMFNGRIPTNVSVDRIDSTRSYEKDNIQLVCMAVNQMKSDMSLEQLLYFCEQIISNNE